VDKQGFRKMLQNLHFNEQAIKNAFAISERFEEYIKNKKPTTETAWDFSKILIKEKSNDFRSYLALLFYCQFIKQDEMYVGFMELIDGGEVGDNLYKGVTEKFGKGVRDEVFNGKGKIDYGTPSPEKPVYLHPIIKRLQKTIGIKACKEFLSACLRDLPDRMFLDERNKFFEIGNIDEFLVKKKEDFLERLKNHQKEGRLFFVQEINDAVLDLVRNNPEMGAGKREGNKIYETKIPYMAKKYLAEKDPTLKRYYACHCPWSRDAIKNGDIIPAQIFCHCSAGFMKKSWEFIFKQPIKVDVLETVLSGGECCRFAIHLPKEALKNVG
jgi:hypothetical protein